MHDTLPEMANNSNRPRARMRVIPALLCGFLLAVSACSSDSGAASVTIYSGRTENLIGPILEEFAAETGINVAVNYGQSADLALLITEEGDQTPADVFLSQSPGAVEFLDEAGRLAVLPDDVLSLVPESVQDSDGRWIGFSGRQRVLVYNSNLVDPADLPSSVFELGDSRWSGQLGIAPPNGSFQDFVTAMRATVGDDTTSDWLESLAANDVQTYPNNNSIVAAVGRGEIEVGLVNHYYNYRFVAEDPDHAGLNHQFAIDDPGSVLIVTGAAVIEGTENSEEAQQLIEWLLSESAQRFFADETFEYPLAPGIEPAADIPPAEFSSVGTIDFGSLGDGLEGTRRLIADAGLEG